MGSTMDCRRSQEEEATPRRGGLGGFGDSAARSVYDVKRDLLPVCEHLLQTQRDVAQPAPRLHGTSPMAEIRDDREAKVDVPVSATCKPSVAKPKSARKAPTPPVPDDSDASSMAKDAQETVVALSSVPEEKLKLLEKLVRAGRVTLGGVKVAVEVRDKRLRVAGNAQQSQTAMTKALEAATQFCIDRAGVNRRQLELLMSDRGQRWLDELLTQNDGPIVVLFARDSADYVVAADRDAAARAKSVLKRSLASETIPFGAELAQFLQSRQWADAVVKYEARWLIRVTRDVSAPPRQIVLDGCARAVKNVVVDVRQLLRQNSTMNRQIQLTTGDYRVIRKHLEAEVLQCLKNEQGFALQMICYRLQKNKLFEIT